MNRCFLRWVMLVALMMLTVDPVGSKEGDRPLDKCLDGASTTFAMGECLRVELERLEQAIEVSRKNIEAKLTSEERNRFREIERVWADYVLLECEFSSALFKGGSFESIEFGDCKAGLLQDHADTLSGLEMLLAPRAAPVTE